MSRYYVDINYVLDLSTIVSYSRSDNELGSTIVITLSNGQSIEVDNYFTHSNPLFNALVEWHDQLWRENGNGATHVS